MTYGTILATIERLRLVQTDATHVLLDVSTYFVLIRHYNQIVPFNDAIPTTIMDLPIVQVFTTTPFIALARIYQ